MPKPILILTALLLWFSSYSSTVDSLKIALQNSTENCRAKILNNIALELFDAYPDSALGYLKTAIDNGCKTGNDTTLVISYNLTGLSFKFIGELDSALIYYTHSLEKATKINDSSHICNVMINFGSVYLNKGNYPLALDYFYRALIIAERIKDLASVASACNNIGLIYDDLGAYAKALNYHYLSLEASRSAKDSSDISRAYTNLAIVYDELGNSKKALEFDMRSLEINRRLKDKRSEAITLVNIGAYYSNTGDQQTALKYYDEAMKIKQSLNDKKGMINLLNNQGLAYAELKDYGKAEKLFFSALSLARECKILRFISSTYKNLSDLYVHSDYKKAYEYYKKSTDVNDSIFNREMGKQMAEMQTRFKTVKKEKEIELTKNELAKKLEVIRHKNTQRNALIAGILLVLVLMVVLLRSYRQKKKTNERLSAKNDLIERQSEEKEKLLEELKATLENLKATQEQLVQSEKLAYLGQLIAGIAHEIQNPLNFVNNFASLSQELIAELKECMVANKEKIDAESYSQIMELCSLVDENAGKINTHGKRATSIVQNMLQHSRNKTGEFRETDINGLVTDYVTLAYQGFKASGSAVEVTIHTVLDKDTGSAVIIPDELSRVVINMVNNACYAVREKKLKSPENYHPQVWVSTKREGSKYISISIKDNGTGIPQFAVDKIFSPFFTTKPTGQGTGLGLSMAYDIITKMHRGKLEVHSKEGEYTEFVIQLPL